MEGGLQYACVIPSQLRWFTRQGQSGVASFLHACAQRLWDDPRDEVVFADAFEDAGDGFLDAESDAFKADVVAVCLLPMRRVWLPIKGSPVHRSTVVELLVVSGSDPALALFRLYCGWLERLGGHRGMLLQHVPPVGNQGNILGTFGNAASPCLACMSRTRWDELLWRLLCTLKRCRHLVGECVGAVCW